MQKPSTSTLKAIALISYFSLLIYMPIWLIFISPSEGLSPLLSLAIFTAPLLFPLKGLIKGNPYTYAWTNFIVMIYFLHSLTTLWVLPHETLWAGIELLLATILFISATYYAKFRGQELGLSIRKPK
jgi:uncharacterized membrane protein